METMVCPHCGKKFKYTEVTQLVEHEKKIEPIVCPYCRKTAAEMISSGYFTTRKLEEFQ